MEGGSNNQREVVRRLTLDTLRQPKALVALAFAGGAIFGLIVLGWWLLPVEWKDATAQELRADLREDYLRAAIDSYTLNPNEDLARRRLATLGDSMDETMATVASSPGGQNVESIAQFQLLMGNEVSLQQPEGGVSGPPAEEGPVASSRSLLLTMCAITGVLGVALTAIYFVRRRHASEKSSPFERSAGLTSAMGSDYATDTPPLSQWMTTYMIGDDLFDDSFSIDSPGGEFLGECGLGIAETIGVGSPKRVTAFEVWLFDKNDIQTVTKVIMSSHLFRDEVGRERLSAKGEPVLANPGVESVLETATLQLVARIVDMQYGEGALPQDSFFERATVELAVWSKT